MQPKLLVSSLQGTRAQILFAFLFAGHAMDVAELMTWTRRDRKTHYRHLESLCDDGFLAKQTVAHGREIYLLGSEMLPALRAWVALLGVGNPALEGGMLELQESAFRTPGPTTTTVLTLSKLNKELTAVVVNSTQESAFRTPGIDTSKIQYESYDASFEKNLAACKANHIGEPTATRLSMMPHVCPRLIVDHVKSLVRGETTGLAIRRIEGDEVPRTWLDEIEQIERPEAKNDNDTEDESEDE